MLLERGANPNLRDEDGWTALSIAEIEGPEMRDRGYPRSREYDSIVKLLESKMRTQKAEQRLALSKLLGMIPDYDTAIEVGKNIGILPYNSEVAIRMREEEERDHEHLDWLQSFSQYDGGRNTQRWMRRRRRGKLTKKSRQKGGTKQIGGNIINLKGCISNTQGKGAWFRYKKRHDFICQLVAGPRHWQPI